MFLLVLHKLAMTKKIYFENLDGLRFLCFLSIFFYHAFYSKFDYILSSETYQFIKKGIFGNGNLGVSFFFVLSGFLITYLLIEEKNGNGQIDVKYFWIRRVLRIWPLFYFCVVFGFFIFPLFKSALGQQPNETASLFHYLTFTNNFDLIRNGPPDSSVLSTLWSVAVEEQFYLVWPIILYFLPIRKYWIAFLAIIVGSWVFRVFNTTYAEHEHHTLSCIGDMAIGAMGAWLIQTKDNVKEGVQNLPKYAILLMYACFWAVYFFRDELLSNGVFWVSVFERSIIAILMLLIILEQCFAERSFVKMSRFKIMTRLGKISYGLYCLHKIGLLVATTVTSKLGINTELWQVLFIDTTIAFGVSILMSEVSYRFYEKPFLKLKEKFAYITTH